MSNCKAMFAGRMSHQCRVPEALGSQRMHAMFVLPLEEDREGQGTNNRVAKVSLGSLVLLYFNL